MSSPLIKKTNSLFSLNFRHFRHSRHSRHSKLQALISYIKSNSSKFINEKKWMPGRFRWQEGYGAFSYSHSQINNVIHYIDNQEEHHKKTKFREEYLKLLEIFELDYDPKYLFDWSD